MRRYTLVALLAFVVCAGEAASVASAGDDDRPARRSQANVEQRLRVLDKRIKLLEGSANRYQRWTKCISWVRVSEVGDRDHRYGYLYEDVDGTGADKRPALAIDRSKSRYSGYMFLKFARRASCRSAATVPGGTADPAFHLARATGAEFRVQKSRVLKQWTAAALGQRTQLVPTNQATQVVQKRKKASQKARLRNLARRAARVDRLSERFDQWESCLSWVPVTEYGDPDGRFGYLFDGSGSPGSNYKPAITVDISEWDDPDYEFLAFVGKDRPFSQRECDSEPGESVD